MRTGKIFASLLILACVLPVEAGFFKKGKPVEGPANEPLPPHKGPKKIVAVHDFENKVENANKYWWYDPKLGTGMSDMLVTSLMNSGRFIVLERETLEEGIIKEQDLAASGRTTKAGHAKIGKILQAQALIKGAVTLMDEGTKGKSGGTKFKIKNFSVGLGGSGGESQVGVDIRIFDTATSQVLAAKTCKGIAKAKGKALSFGVTGTGGAAGNALSFGGKDFEKTPLGDATRNAITSCMNFIAIEMAKIPWAGKIIKVSGDGKIYINSGKRNNVNIGETFMVYQPGEELIDPDTGESLGSEETFLGKIQIVSLKEKFSICTSVQGQSFAKDNIVRWTES